MGRFEDATERADAAIVKFSGNDARADIALAQLEVHLLIAHELRRLADLLQARPPK